MDLGLVSSYLALIPSSFSPLLGVGNRDWGGTETGDIQSDNTSCWVGTRWELHPKKPQDIPGHLLQEKEEMFLLSAP